MAKEKAQTKILVGVDDGYRETKLAWRDRGTVKVFKIPSIVRIGALGTTSLDGKVSGYETEGITYSVGDFTDGEETRFPGYAFSPIVRVLVNHALVSAGFSGKEIEIATGLPPRDSFLPSGRKNLDLIEKKRQSFGVPVSRRDLGPLPEIVGHEVYTQGIGALVDYLSGVGMTGIEAPVGVVDIGGRTTDVAVIIPGEAGMSIDHRRSGSENIGVLDVFDEISRLIRERESLDEKISMSVLERAMKTGKMMLWSRETSVEDIVRSAKAEIGERIRRFVSSKLGRGSDLQMVLFTGGGALALPELSSLYPHTVQTTDPQFSNARGFLSYLELMQGE